MSAGPLLGDAARRVKLRAYQGTGANRLAGGRPLGVPPSRRLGGEGVRRRPERRLQGCGRVIFRLPLAPDRARPAEVVGAAADDVDVQLAGDVAELTDVQLLERTPQRRADGAHR